MMMLPFRSAVLASVALTIVWARGARAQDDVLQRAMRDELTRSIKELRLGQLARPYFISYRVIEHQGVDASAMNGSLLSSNDYRGRLFDPEVRVGDYAFDNTNFMGFGGSMVAIGALEPIGMSLFSGNLPLDDNYLELRRQIWLATDVSYKQAAELFESKRAALLNRARRDSLPDFSRAAPTLAIDTLPVIPFTRAAAEALVRELSSVPELEQLEHSHVQITVANARMLLMNTEGTNTLVGRPLIMISSSATTQATDGTPLAASIHVYARSMQSLPAREELATIIRGMALRLDSLRTAPVLERYTGPVLFEGRAAAEVFAELFAPALVGRRRSDAGQPDFQAMLEATGRGVTSFTDRIGSRVLPTFLSVIDDPSIAEQRGRALFGGYKVDDEGVRGRRKALVDNGIVKQVLTNRTPVQGALESTGNGRGNGAAPSNVIVTSTTSVSDAELKNRLLALMKQHGVPYGIIVRELGRGAMSHDDPMEFMTAMQGRSDGRSVLLAYRVYPDGHEELVRGARLTDFSTQSFRDIVAVSSSATVYHRPAISGGLPIPFEMMEEMGEMGGPALPLASYVVPSMLFEDLSLERAVGEQPKPPLSPPPEKGSR